MILVDASTQWSHDCLLSTRAFARLIAQIIFLIVQFPNHPIKMICLDNATEYTSQAFNAYYTSIVIIV